MFKRIICAFGAFFILTTAAFAAFDNFENIAVIDDRIFFEGMAAVESGGLWGYVDNADTLVIPFQYTKAEPFSEGRAFVKDSSGWHCIDKTGRILFTLVCDEVYPFSDGIARYKRGGLYGFIDKNGQSVTEPKWSDARDAKNGFIVVCEEALYGYIDYSGEFFIAAQYDEAYDFTGNAAYVVLSGEGMLISAEGETIYSGVCGDINEGLAKIRSSHEDGTVSYGFVNESGLVVIQPTWEDVGIPSENRIAVKKDGKWGYIDFLGNISSEFIWDFAAPYSGGFARVAKLPEGESLPTSFIYSAYAPNFSYTYLNITGSVISETLAVSDARDFSDGRAAVCVEELWGFIDTNATQVIPCAYSYVSDFSSNNALAVTDGSNSIISDKGALKTYYAEGEERPADGSKEDEDSQKGTYIRDKENKEPKKRGIVSYISMTISALIIIYCALCSTIRLSNQARRNRRRKAAEARTMRRNSYR